MDGLQALSIPSYYILCAQPFEMRFGGGKSWKTRKNRSANGEKWKTNRSGKRFPHNEFWSGVEWNGFDGRTHTSSTAHHTYTRFFLLSVVIFLLFLLIFFLLFWCVEIGNAVKCVPYLFLFSLQVIYFFLLFLRFSASIYFNLPFAVCLSTWWTGENLPIVASCWFFYLFILYYFISVRAVWKYGHIIGINAELRVSATTDGWPNCLPICDTAIGMK